MTLTVEKGPGKEVEVAQMSHLLYNLKLTEQEAGL